MTNTPRMQSALMDDPTVGFGNVWKVGCDIERELNIANLRIKQLEDALIPLVKMHKLFILKTKVKL